MIKLYIVIVLFNNRKTFSGLWSALLAQTFEGWHAIVIDNNSTDGSGGFGALIAEKRFEFIQNNVNRGFSKAANQGLRLAIDRSIERCMLLNPDTTFQPDFLSDLMQAWIAHEWPIIAPRVMLSSDPSRSWYAGGHLDYGWVFANQHHEHIAGDARLIREVDFASGCCLGLQTKLLRKIGLLDERFFVYWEDTDLCLRLKATGQPIMYIQHPFLLHDGGASSGGERSAAAQKLFYTSYAMLLCKHFGFRAALRTVFRVYRREAVRATKASGHAANALNAMLTGVGKSLARSRTR